MGEQWTEEIGQAMGIPAESCKKKFITLLVCHRREKMKTKNSHGTGKAMECKWFAFEAMSFLAKTETPRKNRLNTITSESNGMKTGHGEIAEVLAEEDSLATPEVAPEPPRKSAKPDPKLQMLKEAFGILKTASSKPTDPISNIKNYEIRSFLEFVVK
ncbi:uncharacterized protein LOC126733725 [Anthonomus grandis grandis]|uniref:uncharacterized protein LOC126733725 n=1 Tax=Anthonomus grandis grandis TaxID=2921223 RepID=UPI002166A97B|nr:uncharacterized protein LOC126733725 [Anthonomus grandis grandis]